MPSCFSDQISREFISLRGVRQNNLKNIDLQIPKGQLTVITGRSGSGKSSLAFQTLYAEGQRRYVETFSPYVRQFFDRMDKPAVDQIDGILPAIAIEQKNQVRTTRSTVGTLTEVNDYLKLLFSRLGRAFDPVTQEEIKPDHSASILTWCLEKERAGKAALILFPVILPEKVEADQLLPFLQSQGYLRFLIKGKLYRSDEPLPEGLSLPEREIMVVQDRIKLSSRQKSRLSEAIEQALTLGKGRLVVDLEGEEKAFSTQWLNPATGFTLPAPSSGLFSFNSPIGACPTCRGFGRVIGIDLKKAVPNESLSIQEGCIKPFQGERGEEALRDLRRCASEVEIDLESPYEHLSEEEKDWVLYGERPHTSKKSSLEQSEELWEQGKWYGIRGFFDWLETKAYKMHVRVFLSRYRSYTECGECRGSRLKPEALCFQVAGKTLPQIWRTQVSELSQWSESLMKEHQKADHTTKLILEEIQHRLQYLCEVGLGYLTLERPTRTLSGGELARVNLTSCLGASLANTLFVLDEPTVGLHSRDIDALIKVMHDLRDKGNTVVVVEHEERVMRSADHLIDIGPEAGENGGQVVYEGSPRRKSSQSRTLKYLTGQIRLSFPEEKRKPKRFLSMVRASHHNVQKLSVKIPLGVFCTVTGVSGSGKSTLVHSILYENLARELGQHSEGEMGYLHGLKGAHHVDQVLLVDQSPLARTPRSTPAVFLGFFDGVRQLFTLTPEAKAAGLTPGYFSFNSGQGRCQRCAGNGFEKIEMQFLSDLFLTCPDCQGRRYQTSTLQYQLEGQSVADILGMTVTSAQEFFSHLGSDEEGTKKFDKLRKDVLKGLESLLSVGLGYLRLGQALNTLSGGESQRLKLCKLLREKKSNTLMILDEPTTGLHFDDIKNLLDLFQDLVERGHSLLVIEHQLDVILASDYVIEMGPGAGDQGGGVVQEGTPQELALSGSITGSYLASQMKGEETSAPPVKKRASKKKAVIEISGARQHHLKNIDLQIPRDELVVISGLSGSGKSTLAFDLLFAEGQRRFLDSMSPYARQFAEQLEKPDVNRVSGLPPTVAIEQSISQGGGKSTVATVTEIYHFLRLLYAKVGIQHCPASGEAVVSQTADAITQQVFREAKSGKVMVMAPIIRNKKGYHSEVATWAGKQGFTSLLVDQMLCQVEDFEPLERYQEHDLDVVIAEVSKKTKLPQIASAVELALKHGKGAVRILDSKKKLRILSTSRVSLATGESFEELDPAHFSYNSPRGWCLTCRGYGTISRGKKTFREADYNSALEAELAADRNHEKKTDEEILPCPDCEGNRLNPSSRAVKIHSYSLPELTAMSVSEAKEVSESFCFEGREAEIARDILPEISQRLSFLEEVGLSYLQLDRSATTLSGGEAQRIRLAAQLGSNLNGVLYVLDEPTIGLHPRDNERLLGTLESLRDQGNSLIVVEHDEETIERAGHLIDLGPGAGRLGGEVVYEGVSPKNLSVKERGKYLKSPTLSSYASPLAHPLRGERRALPSLRKKEAWMSLKGCTYNNLKKVNVQIPLQRLTVISGVSGCGKSSLMRGTLAVAAEHVLSRKKTIRDKTWKSLSGFDSLHACYEVDQSPIGKTSRSCPATYVKIFDDIRKLFANVPESRMRGYTASRFSFNNKEGQCPECKGNGRVKLEMDFLPTTWVPCESCHGERYHESTLEISYRGYHIGEILRLPIADAVAVFENHPKLSRTLRLLNETGLGYLQLGQPSPTLSGGEAQRMKLVAELAKGRVNPAKMMQAKQNLYLIEEPTIGLHQQDVKRLIEVLHRLVDEGHTVVVIEHNTAVMAEADFLIDMGPEAGDLGGQIVIAGTPEKVCDHERSVTAVHLRKQLSTVK